MEQQIRTATLLANLLDNQFSLFGKKFGLNGVLGLLPVAGDIITLLLSLQIVLIAHNLRVPGVKLLEMLWNVLLNYLIGIIPVIGDYADFFHKSNLKNLAILKQYAGKPIIEAEYVKA
jgi:hypothetical protein